MEIKLTNFFCFFLRFTKLTRRKLEKEIETNMDNTMKEYEHRRLVCEHECKVGEKYVLPQA